MSPAEERLNGCYESLAGRIPFQPKVALVLGSGLGGFADEMQQEAAVAYGEIKGFPVSTVPGHKGRFVFGSVHGVPAVIMQGRVHYYEGYSMEDVVLPVRLMRKMGADILFLTNAAGGINAGFRPGDFMMITDQIGDFVPSPLRGPNLDSLGPRFCDMSQVYDRELQAVLRKTAGELNITLREGVYIQLPGPSYETPAEVRMCRTLGADAVGDEHGLRGCCGCSLRASGMRNLLHYQYGLRHYGTDLCPMQKCSRQRMRPRRHSGSCWNAVSGRWESSAGRERTDAGKSADKYYKKYTGRAAERNRGITMGEKAGAGKKNEVRKEIFSEISRADGLKLEVLVTEPPEGRGLRGILQISHGMCEHKERYLDFMEYISGLGFACLIHDHRGHGASVRAEGDLGYMYGGGAAALLADLHQLTGTARGEMARPASGAFRPQHGFPGCPGATPSGGIMSFMN